jgi:hypothetical protein
MGSLNYMAISFVEKGTLFSEVTFLQSQQTFWKKKIIAFVELVTIIYYSQFVCITYQNSIIDLLINAPVNISSE